MRALQKVVCGVFVRRCCEVDGMEWSGMVDMPFLLLLDPLLGHRIYSL